MDFLLFQVLFVVLVIALAVSGWLLLRSLRERREARSQGWTPPPRAPRHRKSAPEPVADTEPPRVRKRQIVPLATLEASPEADLEAPATDVSLPEGGNAPAWAETTAAEETPEAEPVAEPVLATQDEHIAPSVSSPAGAPATGLVHGETMELLEEAFVRLQREEITLDDYCDRLAAQERALGDRVAVLSASGDPEARAALDDALAAQEAVRWCRQWADDLVREAAADQPPP